MVHGRSGRAALEFARARTLRRGPDDNPTVGIILCSHKDASIVRYSVLHGNEQLFASKYKLVLPSEDELRAELDRAQLQQAQQVRQAQH
ncbi:PDDEXK nuclease domain-containing protein [Massilia sp. CCM 9210]|nr:PDDEXK nuclease domain-containing protein [Massilia sp. CCM 9210]